MDTRALTLVLVAAACAPPVPEPSAAPVEVAPAPRGEPPPQPRHDEELDGLVVLAPGTELFDAPSGSVRARVPSSGFHMQGTVRALGRKGDFVEIETDTYITAPTCRRPYQPVSDANLRLWAHVDDLLPVVARATRIEFDDGTALTIDPGTPVDIHDGTARGVLISHELVLAPIPMDAVDVFFQPPTTIRGYDAEFTVPEDAEPILGGHPLPTLIVDRHRLAIIGKGGPGASSTIEMPKRRMLVYAWRRDGEGAILELRSRCAVFEARIASKKKPPALPESEFGVPTIDVDNQDLRHGFDLPARDRGLYRPREDGTPVYWDDGAVAGTLGFTAGFAAPGDEREGRRCFDLPFDPPMTLCVAIEDLEFEPPPASVR